MARVCVMGWERSRAAVPRFEFLDVAGSTNDELRAAATGEDAAAWPHGSVIVTEGNGRYYEPAPGRLFTLGLEWRWGG